MPAPISSVHSLSNMTRNERKNAYFYNCFNSVIDWYWYGGLYVHLSTFDVCLSTDDFNADILTTCPPENDQ